MEKSIALGKGVLKISPSSVLKVDYSNYHVEGYYAEPIDWPFETFYGTLNGNQNQSLITVPANKKFIIKTFTSDNSRMVAIYENADIVLYGTHATSNSFNTLYTHGEGHLALESGSALSVSSPFGQSSTTYSYYIEGYYTDE